MTAAPGAPFGVYSSLTDAPHATHPQGVIAMSTTIEPLLIPVWPDAADALGVGRSTAFALAASGALPSVSIGKRRLVPVAGLREYVRRLSAAGPKVTA
jgi:excisionase family DNA binding protein